MDSSEGGGNQHTAVWLQRDTADDSAEQLDAFVFIYVVFQNDGLVLVHLMEA